MKAYFLFLFCLIVFIAVPQVNTSLLNTAKDCLYMTAAEREMIYEINRVRSAPLSYIQYLMPLLKEAKSQLKYSKGDKHYSLTISSTSRDGTNPGTIDTTWYYTNEEEVKALSTLIADLKNLKQLSILQPDSGIYRAAKKHAADQDLHDWKLLHTGSDGSDPLKRILFFSPLMAFGNENIGGRYGHATNTPRDMVIQLLVDSGIPGYGHRYNILNPQWTHIACTESTFRNTTWWIQVFGYKKAGKK